MEFDKRDNIKILGKISGFVTFYLIFTTLLYFILKYLEKIPEDWNYLMMANITVSIVLIGVFLRLLLK
jgi:hypothetical protein